MFVIIYLDIYGNIIRKNFSDSSCLKCPKIIEKMRTFYFHSSLWCLKKVLWRPEGCHKTFVTHQKEGWK